MSGPGVEQKSLRVRPRIVEMKGRCDDIREGGTTREWTSRPNSEGEEGKRTTVEMCEVI